jgi:hypothetical protein
MPCKFLLSVVSMLLIMSGQVSEAQVTKPVVHVLVSIEDPDLLYLYDEDVDALDNVAFSVAKTLAARFEKATDYVQWTPVRPERWSHPRSEANQERPKPPLNEATARVALAMRQRRDMSVFLKFEIETKSTEDDLEDVEPWDVYVSSNLRRATDLKGIKRTLETTIETNFDTRFEARFDDAVELYIPVAVGLTIINGDGRLRFVIPIQWRDLKPGEASVFFTQMMIPSKSGLVWVAKLHLAPPQRYQERDALVIATPVHECKRHKFAFEPIEARGSEANCWEAPSSNYPGLQRYLTNEVLKEAPVFLVDYFRDTISQ